MHERAIGIGRKVKQKTTTTKRWAERLIDMHLNTINMNEIVTQNCKDSIYMDQTWKAGSDRMNECVEKMKMARQGKARQGKGGASVDETFILTIIIIIIIIIITIMMLLAWKDGINMGTCAQK
jgi:hypothetical protein